MAFETVLEPDNEEFQKEDFPTISSGIRQFKVSPKFMEWDPTIDMITVSHIVEEDDKTEKQDPVGLGFYRLSGQEVWAWPFTQSNKKTNVIRPQAIAWNDTGRMFALVTKENTCHIYSSNTGKQMLMVHRSDTNSSALKTVAWAKYQFSQEMLDANPLRKLGLSTPIKSLPKLSFSHLGPPPPDSIYVMRQLMDDIIQGKNLDLDNFEMGILLCGNSQGEVLLTLFGTFHIGKFTIDSSANDLSINKIIPFNEYPAISIAMASAEKDGEISNYLYPINLDFLRKYGLYTLDVTAMPTQICALLEYIQGEMNFARQEIKAMTQSQHNFYEKLLATFSKPYSKQNMDEIVAPTLLDTLVTGMASPEVEKWISTLKERGIKKWRKDLFHGYETVRRKLFLYISPAFERLVIHLSHLNGLARWTERGAPLHLDPDILSKAIKTALSTMKITERYVWELNDQFLLFKEYSNWIEILYEQVTMQQMKENVGEGPRIAHTSRVAKYIGKNLTKAAEIPEFGADSKSCSNAEECLNASFDILQSQCHQAFDKVKQGMLSHVKVDTPLKLTSGGEGEYIIKVFCQSAEKTPQNGDESNSESGTDIPERRFFGLNLGNNKAKKSDFSSKKNILYCYSAIYSHQKNSSEIVLTRKRVQTCDEDYSDDEEKCETKVTDIIEICRLVIPDDDINNNSKKNVITKVKSLDFLDKSDLIVLLSKESKNEKEEGEDKESARVLSFGYSDLPYSILSIEQLGDTPLFDYVVSSTSPIFEKITPEIKRSRDFISTTTDDEKKEEEKEEEEEGKSTRKVYNEFEDDVDEDKKTEEIEKKFLPISLAINGREGRRIGCLLDKGLQKYIFFDLDGNYYYEEEEEEYDDDEEEEEENYETNYHQTNTFNENKEEEDDDDEKFESDSENQIR